MKNVFLYIVTVILSCGFALGQREKVLHSFSGLDGSFPVGNLAIDSAGNLYGTAALGGSNRGLGCNQGCGVIFRLSRSGSGVKETVLYNFCSLPNCVDGAVPESGLILDSAGNLYGTAGIGSQNNNCVYEGGCGVVFELSPGPGDKWTKTVLYAFTGMEDGENPVGGLIFDQAGNLYGTTEYGLTGGVVFELSSDAGSWKETVLHTFTGPPDGWVPSASLVFDSAGNLYGVTQSGGSQNDFCSFYFGCGVIFELTPTQDDSWQETVLHTFTDGADGAFPYGALTVDSFGNLFGTTTQGGNSGCTHGCGVVFELTSGVGGWTDNVLYSFTGGGD